MHWFNGMGGGAMMIFWWILIIVAIIALVRWGSFLSTEQPGGVLSKKVCLGEGSRLVV